MNENGLAPLHSSFIIPHSSFTLTLAVWKFARAPVGQRVGAANVDGCALKAFDHDAVAGFERRLALGRVRSPDRTEDLDRALFERAAARSHDRGDPRRRPGAGRHRALRSPA